VQIVRRVKGYEGKIKGERPIRSKNEGALNSERKTY